MPLPDDALTGVFKTECVYCGAFKILKYDLGSNWSIGDIISYDASAPSISQCHKCKRTKLKIVSAPDHRAAAPLVGFTKLPTK